jgi:carboxypeptidase Taq
MGVHESQSLLWERMVALGRPFNQYLLPKLTGRFSQLPKDLTAEQLYAAVNVVKHPSMIRVEADEVTYPLHIILRCGGHPHLDRMPFCSGKEGGKGEDMPRS